MVCTRGYARLGIYAATAASGMMIASCQTEQLASGTYFAPINSGLETAGSATRGGVAPSARVLHVSSLEDNGPGTLREALAQQGPRVIVFDVGGPITLQRDLSIFTPFVTIAGQTAPDPGIALFGASVRIRTHDVIVQHIAVRPGRAPVGSAETNRDGFTVGGGSRMDREIRDIVLENVSATWSTDEAIDIFRPTKRAVSVRASIIAQALDDAGHPRGRHSMGLLIGWNVRGVDVTGNLFAHNMYRNPVICAGASAYVGANLIVNPGENAIHIYGRQGEPGAIATIVDNVVVRGGNTDDNVSVFYMPIEAEERSPGNVVFQSGNCMSPPTCEVESLTSPAAFTWAAAPPIASPEPRPSGVQDVEDWVLRYAGPRPSRRMPADAAIIAGVRAGSGSVLNAPPIDLGPRSMGTAARRAQPPRSPFVAVSAGIETRIERWLCQQHFAVGGAPSARCPDP